MTSLRETIEKGQAVAAARPWPRRIVDQALWIDAARQIAEGQGDLMSLWADASSVHMAIALSEPFEISILTSRLSRRTFPIGRAPFICRRLRLERAIHDLFGLTADGSPDQRPWLDHGRFGVKYPCGASQPANSAGAAYAFLPADGEPLHQIPVGPVHAGIIEPGHFRFSANGEIIVRLEERLGYVHKGIDS